MTTITLLGGDWEILFHDEITVPATANTGLRVVRRASGAPTEDVISTRTLYSAIAEVTDDFIAMGFTNPMIPVTPNSFTLVNNFFMPKSSTEYLKEGALTADWSLSVPEAGDTDGHGVLRKVYSLGLGVAFVTGDIGRQITDGTDEGTLLDFEIAQNGDTIVWIRPNDSTPVTGDIFNLDAGTLEVTTDGGTGTVDLVSTEVGLDGNNLWSAIQAIGSVPSGTEVYVVQDRIKLNDWEGNFQWWATDPTVSLGIVSILVKVIDAGVTIAEGDVEVFSRRYTSLYDNFRLNVIAGGFSALPLASAPDINNTTGYRRTTLSGGANTWEVGNGIYNGASWATATSRGIITVGGSGATPTLEYYIVGDLTDLTAAAVTEYDFATGADGDASGTAGAPAVNLLGPTDPASGEGGTVTITLGAVEVDHDGIGGVEPYSAQIDSQGPGGTGVTAAKTYERGKYVCRRGGNTTDLFGVGVNQPGETYRGADGVYEVDAFVAGFTEGDDADIVAKAAYSGRIMSSHDRVIDHIVMMDQQTSLQTLSDNDALRDETPDTVTIENGAGATLFFAGAGGGIQVFTSPKGAPFGTFTGTVLFGARCINYTGFHDNDTQNYILTDDLGVLRTPPNTVTYSVGNTLALDRVYAARDTGVLGVVDKDQFGGLAAPAVGYNNQGDVRVRVAGTLDVEVPPIAWIRIIETTLLEEHRYPYGAVDGTDEEFDLVVPTSDTGTATSNSTTQLIDTGQSFDGATPVEVGMMVRNTFGGKTTHVWEVTNVVDSETLDISPLYGTPDDFDIGDTYEINKLIQTYAAADNIHDLILDVEAVGATTSNSFVKTLAADFATVCNVRQGKIILPFDINQNVGDGGASITVVRTPDTIAV